MCSKVRFRCLGAPDISEQASTLDSMKHGFGFMLDILEQSLIAAFRQLPEQRRTEIVLSCRDEADQLKK